MQDHCLTEIHRIFTPQQSTEDYIEDSTVSENSDKSETKQSDISLENLDKSETKQTDISLEGSLNSNIGQT